MSFSYKFENNSDKVKREMEEREEAILYAIGLKWQSICSKIITKKKIIDTGRLRASLTFITPKRESDLLYKGRGADVRSSDRLTGKSDKKTLVVGTNVEYARKQEFTNPKGSFLRQSIANYSNDYKKIAEEIWKG